MTTILVTGANGFVGSALCSEALRRGVDVCGATREAGSSPAGVRVSAVGEIDENTDWTEALKGREIVIHLAARVHVMKEFAENPLGEFRKVNVRGTENLAYQAVAAGVKRIVFVSTIGVNGLQTQQGKTYSELDAPKPHNEYAVTKLEAEQSLLRIAAETGLEVVIVRPPLVYGSGAKGNLAWLVKILLSGWPLPFASLQNRRSMIYLGNLVDALILCAQHPAAAGEMFLVRDGQDVSTPEFIHEVAAALGVRAKIFHFPPLLMHAAAFLLGRKTLWTKLNGSLQINDEKIREKLKWVPRYTFQVGMAKTYLKHS